jgi:hypothetical protein
MPYIKSTITDATKAPEVEIPQIGLNTPTPIQITKKIESYPIKKTAEFAMSFNSSATVAPTHKPRNFYEQLVIKDSGSVVALWLWSQEDGSWHSTTLN